MRAFGFVWSTDFIILTGQVMDCPANFLPVISTRVLSDEYANVKEQEVASLVMDMLVGKSGSVKVPVAFAQFKILVPRQESVELFS